MASSSDDRTLYIGNLDRNVTEEILYELFLQAGPVERVRVMNNNDGSFHYGFVTYKHDVSIDYAMELYKGTCLFNKALNIKIREKGSNNSQTNNNNNYNRYNSVDTVENRNNKRNVDFSQLLKEHINSVTLQNYTNPNALFNNFKSLLDKNQQPGRNKHYRHEPPKYSSRGPGGQRQKYKGRAEANKPYNRKKRY